MAERVLEMVVALITAALLACAEIVELLEPRPLAPEWKYRSYRVALRLTRAAR